MALRYTYPNQTISIRYYNVLFYLTYRKHIDEFKIEQLTKRIAVGELMTMWELSDWCMGKMADSDICYGQKLRRVIMRSIRDGSWKSFLFF